MIVEEGCECMADITARQRDEDKMITFKFQHKMHEPESLFFLSVIGLQEPGCHTFVFTMFCGRK